MSPQSGTAVAISSGNSLVYYNASNLLPTYVEVKVSPVNDVTVLDLGKMVVSNSPGPSVNGSYVINVRFGEPRDGFQGCPDAVIEGSANADKLSFPFSCELSLENSQGVDAGVLFDIKPGYELGRSACFIFPKSMSQVGAKFVASCEGKMVLTVTLRDPGKETEHSSKPARLEYVPSFFVEKTEVELNNTVKNTQVEVRGVLSQLSSLEVRRRGGKRRGNRTIEERGRERQ